MVREEGERRRTGVRSDGQDVTMVSLVRRLRRTLGLRFRAQVHGPGRRRGGQVRALSVGLVLLSSVSCRRLDASRWPTI